MRYYQIGLGLIVIVSLICTPLVVSAKLTADEVLSEMGWSAEEKNKILAGEFVTLAVRHPHAAF